MKFSDNEYARMRLELAASATRAVLRHIAAYERKCYGRRDTAMRLLAEHCNVQTTTVKRWTECGIPTAQVQNVLDFVSQYPCVWNHHQLAPGNKEAHIWLQWEFNRAYEGKPGDFTGWDRDRCFYRRYSRQVA